MLKISTEKYVEVADFDKLVRETYGRPYKFQQQEGCRSRQLYYFEAPSDGRCFKRDSVPEVVNGEVMGVSLKGWLERDPLAPVGKDAEPWAIDLFWYRTFYPCPEELINDLFDRGLIEEGSYLMVIDW